VDELALKLEIAFSMVSRLSTNTTFGVGWYVDSEASRHVTFNMKISNKFREQDASLQVKLGDNATYLVTIMGSITF